MKPKRMTDKELADELAEYRRLRASSKADEELADAGAVRIIAEMNARKEKVGVFGGIRVIVKESRKLVSFDKAKKLLGPRKIKPFLREPAINKKAWDAGIAEGIISEGDAAGCLAEFPVKPHIYANPVKAEPAAAA